jgi:hypothetical protein
MKTKISLFIISSFILCSCSSFYQLINVSPSPNLKEISFSQESPNPLYQFYYADTLANRYLSELRTSYKIDLLVKVCIKLEIKQITIGD